MFRVTLAILLLLTCRSSSEPNLSYERAVGKVLDRVHSRLLSSAALPPDRTWATRGGRTLSAAPLFIITITVGIPALSIALATSPPDRLHTGQVEERKTASTPSSFSRRATSGAVSSMSLSQG